MDGIIYEQYTGSLEESTLITLAAINQEIFGFGEKPEHLAALFQSQNKLFLCFAKEENDVVGFKVGFQERPYYFDSWRGGVLASHRRRGIAQRLMQIQHEWCKEQGFRIVSTITGNTNTGMLITNLRGGFQIVGTYFDRKKHVKVVQQKWLVEPPE